jgi:hypothetical protein
MRKHLLINVVLIVFAQLSWAEITGELELLKVVADKYEANHHKLKTWQGTARITSSVVRGKGEEAIRQQGIYQASFLVDQTLEAVRWMWMPQEETESKRGKKTISTVSHEGGMSRGDYDYLVYYYDYGQPDEERSLRIYSKGAYPLNFQGTSFNPMRILNSFAPLSLAGRLRSYYDRTRLPGTWSGTVTRDGHNVALGKLHAYYPQGIDELTLNYRLDYPDGTYSVRPELEEVSGELCHVIDFPSASYWFAHAKSMLVMKSVTRDGKGMEKKRLVREIAKTTTNKGDLWYPRIVEMRNAKGQVFRHTVLDFEPYVTVFPEVFKVDFPVGTRIRDMTDGVKHRMGE